MTYIIIIKKYGGIYVKKRITHILADLSDKLELPLTEICHEVSVNIQGRREITVEGVLSIYRYEEECIILEVCDDSIVIKGRRLNLKNYYHSTLCIGGEIDEVSFGGRICQ